MAHGTLENFDHGHTVRLLSGDLLRILELVLVLDKPGLPERIYFESRLLIRLVDDRDHVKVVLLEK